MKRKLITTLLAFALSLSGAAHAYASARDDGEDTATTPEEEREARQLVEEFNGKFVETHDIGPLVKDYFVPDFASRLSPKAGALPFALLDWKEDSAPPRQDDLLRFYVASTNCIQMLVQLYGAEYVKAKRERGREDEPKEPSFAEVMPPEAVELIKTDPLLRGVWDELNKEDDDEQKPDGGEKPGEGANASDDAPAPAEAVDDSPASEGRKETDDLKLDDAEKLRRITSVLEGVSQIMRKHLAAHPFTFKKADAGTGETSAREGNGEASGQEGKAEGPGQNNDDESGVSFDPNKVTIYNHARVLSEEFYGYPAGTRLVCAEAGILHVEMVRVDGRLRILTVYLLMDD